ncbi:uncharacterized protein LOC125764241 [Anopheles funestus]|uniref:uncharacterized protein LOC125764241 n=1 Tax=Anopheles funestus TaxID=62324 RepID=UPI0020C6C8CC|nr:uncharacterized protein LOC125764241 [Anopheles funestus]
MSQESDDSDSLTEEVVTYTVDPDGAPSTEDQTQPPKTKKRKLNTKTVKMQRDNSPPLKTFVYCKSYYRQQVRSLFKLMNATCKLETRVLSAAGAFLSTDDHNEENRSPYFSVLGRRFQTFGDIQ